MAGRRNTSCLTVLACGVGIILLVGVVGMVFAAGAMILDAALTDRPYLARQSGAGWLLLAVLAVANVVVALTGARRPRHGLRVHLRRTAALLIASTGAAWAVLRSPEAGVPLALARRTPDQLGASFTRAGWAAGVVATVAVLVIRLLDRRLRAAARAAPPRTVERPGATFTSVARPRVPEAGEVWWGDVPFVGEDGVTQRPFLVMGVYGDELEVLDITNQPNDHSRDHVRFRRDHDHSPRWLELRIRILPVAEARRYGETISWREWDRLVERLHRHFDETGTSPPPR